MQRIINYGSFLQAYSLKKTLESLGHSVCFIDYVAEKPLVGLSKKKEIRYKLNSNSLFLWVYDFVNHDILKKNLFKFNYRKEYLPILGVGYKKNYNEKVDVAIIGSDEVFNCLQDEYNVGFSKMLFGQNINTDKVISYAASFGYTTLEGLDRYQVRDRIAEYLQSIYSLSVRDENSKRIVEELTHKKAIINLDPVLIYDHQIKNKVDLRDYVILYTYRTRFYSSEEKEMILDFCRRHNKKLVSFGDTQNWVDVSIQVNPLDLLAYFNQADFIITDTFHGAVFSIKLNRPFVCYVRDNNYNKLYDLLERTKTLDRMISSFKVLDEYYNSMFDYSITN